MAFDDTPTTWIANYSSNGTDMTLPIASFSELDASEANTTTGDIRQILFALTEEFYQAYNDTAVADRPGKMRIFRTSTTNESTGVVTRSYNFQFDLAISGIDVADES